MKLAINTVLSQNLYAHDSSIQFANKKQNLHLILVHIIYKKEKIYCTLAKSTDHWNNRKITLNYQEIIFFNKYSCKWVVVDQGRKKDKNTNP